MRNLQAGSDALFTERDLGYEYTQELENWDNY